LEVMKSIFKIFNECFQGHFEKLHSSLIHHK
jgi:hypothetical protein